MNLTLRLIFVTIIGIGCVAAQTPVVDSVVNAASLYKPSQDPLEPGAGAAPGSIIMISGSNLGREEIHADGSPLPKILGDTVVRIGDESVYLFFVSPNEVQAIVPSSIVFGQVGQTKFIPLVVEVAEVKSAPYTLRVK